MQRGILPSSDWPLVRAAWPLCVTNKKMVNKIKNLADFA
jgi:hypothetical protein